MKETGNNYAFIDGQNLNLAIRDQGWRLDFGRFRVYLVNKLRAKLEYSARKKRGIAAGQNPLDSLSS